MASYKAHMAFGVLTAVVWCIVALLLSIVSIWFIPFVFIATIIGAFLPDLDSDTGFPLKILLTVFSIVGGLIVAWITIHSENSSPLLIGGYALISILFIYFGIGGIFKKITRHRGIFHSVPAVLLSFLLTLSLMDYFPVEFKVKIVLSLGVGIGYLCHLILDELYSIVNLGGMPFIPKKSIGTALKFYSKNWKISLTVYVAVGWLLFQNWGQLMNFIK
jgi:hypothetical protein